MSLITIKIPKHELISNLYKYLTILITFHIISSMAEITNFGLFGTIFNYDFIIFLITIALSFLAYYMIIEELINFI